MSWRAVILAAGMGTRMKSDLPKVLHRLEGESLLTHVLRTASRLPIEGSAVIVGHEHERVRAEHGDWGASFVLQEPQLGTGHAVQQAEPFLRGHDGDTLILYGDVPLMRRSTLLELMEEHRHAGNAVTVLTARLPDPSGYGRIVRGADGCLEAIVEDRDLELGSRSIDEINSGIYAFRTAPLLDALRDLKADNRKGEYYLTDTVKNLRRQGLPVGTYTLADPIEISGINTPGQLDEAASILARRHREGTDDCPICDLAQPGAPPAYPTLLARPHAFLAVAVRPYNSGQLVVHPSRHLLRHAELSTEERFDLWGLARLASDVVHEEYRPQGMNLGYTSGKPGEHLGLQIIPRWVGDTNFMPLIADRTLLPEALERTYRRLREVLEGRGR